MEAWGIDSKWCLKPDSDWRPAKSPTFMVLWGGKKGFWNNLELSWQRVAEWFSFGCLRGIGLWGRNLALLPKTLVIIVSTVNRFLFFCYFHFINLCSSCNKIIFDVILLLPPYFCYPDILGRNLPLNKRFLSFPPNSIFGDLPGRQQVAGTPPHWSGSVTVR